MCSLIYVYLNDINLSGLTDLDKWIVKILWIYKNIWNHEDSNIKIATPKCYIENFFFEIIKTKNQIKEILQIESKSRKLTAIFKFLSLIYVNGYVKCGLLKDFDPM